MVVGVCRDRVIKPHFTQLYTHVNPHIVDFHCLEKTTAIYSMSKNLER